MTALSEQLQAAIGAIYRKGEAILPDCGLAVVAIGLEPDARVNVQLGTNLDATSLMQAAAVLLRSARADLEGSEHALCHDCQERLLDLRAVLAVLGDERAETELEAQMGGPAGAGGGKAH